MPSFPFWRREDRESEVGGMFIMGVIGVQSMQEHVVESAGCSLVDWRQSTQQPAVDNMMTPIISIPPTSRYLHSLI